MDNKPTSEIFNFSGKVQFEIPDTDIKVVHLNEPNNILGTHVAIPEKLLDNNGDIPINTKVSGIAKVTYGKGFLDDNLIEVQTIEPL